MHQGNHPSTRAFLEFMRSEMADMRSKGMFIVLPYQHVRDLPELSTSGTYQSSGSCHWVVSPNENEVLES